LSIDIPKTPLIAPSVSLSGTNLVIDWQPTPDTKYYKVFLLDIDYLNNERMRIDLSENCDGTDPKVIADRKCTVPMNSMPWNFLAGTILHFTF
jgi:hypothetical protein